MEQPVFGVGNRILVIAKAGQGIVNEVLKRRLCVFRRYGKVEVVGGAEMIGKMLVHQRDHLPGNGIRFHPKGRRGRRLTGPLLAVIGVEIPLPALRFAFGGHQQTGLAPHLPVEELHPQLFPALGPVRKFLLGGNEPCIRADLHRHSEAFMPATDLFVQPPFPALGGDDFFRVHTLHLLANHRFEALVLVVPVIRLVVHLPAIALQLPGKMAHGAEQQRNLLLVVIGVAGFVMNFGHHHQIPILVGVVESADVSR